MNNFNVIILLIYFFSLIDRVKILEVKIKRKHDFLESALKNIDSLGFLWVFSIQNN